MQCHARDDAVAWAGSCDVGRRRRLLGRHHRGASPFLVQGDQAHAGGWVWVGVNDVDAVHEECRQRGAIIRQPPTNFSWACEMQVADLDRNVLRIGSDPKPNQAFGPWLDMEGRSWNLNVTATGRPASVHHEHGRSDTDNFWNSCSREA